MAVASPLAAMLAGCGNGGDTGAGLFSKPLDLIGVRAGYTYSSLGDDDLKERPATAADLVDASGACPAPAAGPAPQPPPVSAQSGAANAAGAAAPGELASMLGGGVAIGMTECEVVGRLGRPAGVNLGTYPNGLRSAVLTYNGGPRPGVYRFEGGRLVEMDRVEAPAPEPQPQQKKVAKKKSGKARDAAKADNRT